MRWLPVLALSVLCLSIPCAFDAAGPTGPAHTVAGGPDARGATDLGLLGPLPGDGRVLISLDQFLDDGRAPVAFCYAEGTPRAVMAYYEDLRQRGPEGGPRYQLGGRWSGGQGNPRALTWSFVPDGLGVDGGTSDLFSRMDSLFGGDRGLWIAQFEAAFARWAELTGTSYTRVQSGGNDWDDGASWGTGGGGSRGDVRIAMRNLDGGSGVLAYNYFPSNGDMVLDRSESWGSSTNSYRFLRDVVMHEHGHGLGMAHVCSNNSSQLMEPFINTSFDGPQDDDLRGGQRHYGDIYEPNNSAGQATPISLPISLGDVPGANGVLQNYASMLTIDANGETDYFSFAIASASAVTVTVTPVGRTYDSSAQACGGSCCCCDNIDSLTMANLNVQVIDTDGSTVIATANAQPAGAAETLVDAPLPAPGDYYIRVYESGSPAEAQFYRLDATITVLDCNNNGLLDTCDLDCGAPDCAVPGCGQSLDCNGNLLPDECDVDCNGNGIPDDCDIAVGTSADCQPDGVPDDCQTAGNDCNANSVPDDCEPDCNANGVADECDISGGASDDCNLNGIPDDCEPDCNANGIADGCDLLVGTSADCNNNSVPDECDLAGLASRDCNANTLPDDCDIAVGTSADCNTNGVPDECDIASCGGLWNGFDAPPFLLNTGLHGIDADSDGSAWDNPAGTAIVFPIGCQAGGATDNAVKVSVDEGLGTPQQGYVDSEHFRPVGGPADCNAPIYALRLAPKIDFGIDSKWDWEFIVYDAVNGVPVVRLEFASTDSQTVGPDAGFILVKDPTGPSDAYLTTGVPVAAGQCEDLEVVLDNVLGTVSVYVGGSLTVTTTPLFASARRLDYFRLQPVANGSVSAGLTKFSLDAFDLCLTGCSAVPPSVYDCNANGVLDACDVATGAAPDCNTNGIPDSCDIAGGTSQDANGDGVPDECGPSGTCSDGILNQGEDRIDCGGPCPPCACTSDPGCDNSQFCDGSETCDAFGVCQAGGAPCSGATWCNEVNDSCIPHGDGDFDGDLDVDLGDFAAFMRCYGQPAPGGCEPGNLTGSDGTIDQDDFAAFALAMSGP